MIGCGVPGRGHKPSPRRDIIKVRHPGRNRKRLKFRKCWQLHAAAHFGQRPQLSSLDQRQVCRDAVDAEVETSVQQRRG